MNRLLVALKDMVLFSGSTLEITAEQAIDHQLFNAIHKEGGRALAFTLKDHHDSLSDKNDLYLVGNAIEVLDLYKKAGKTVIQINVVERVKLIDLVSDGLHFRADVEGLPDQLDMDEKSEKDILKYIKETTREISQHIKGAGQFQASLEVIDHLDAMIGTLMPYMNIGLEEKQALLEMTSVRKRSLKMIDLLIERKEYIKFQIELQSKMSSDMNKVYRERMLREQLKAIKEELGQGESSSDKDYHSLIQEKGLPDDVRTLAIEEADKLKTMGNHQSESGVIKSYLDLILSLEWDKAPVKPLDLAQAKTDLNSRHYGLKKVKERVMQHLTVMKLKNDKQGSILLLVGPPGTGKTSLAKSVAQALNRKYVRMSLGGVRDESEIRGHRKTYVGAMPGKIIQGMKRAQANNPVFVLDEIDKLGASYQGDPASALLEVLDPEQNHTFMDHYLNVPYDLSDVFFIATANDLRGIPSPLLDRLEVIHVGSYTEHEKFEIAKRHLFNQELEAHGLTDQDLQLADESLKKVIGNYTREAGVRQLKRQLAKIIRVSAEKIVTKDVETPLVVSKDMLYDLLGHELLRTDRVKFSNPPGVVTGLAWTPVGGDVLFIESAFMPGKGQLLLTGQLGDVMKESARLALTLVKSRLADYAQAFKFDTHDLHLHVPAGATPKDGPSAGVTMLTTMASLITGKSVPSDLAMTGEISLRGAVLPVGGIKEKVIAAHRSGVKRLILPIDNQRDLEEVPEEVKSELTFSFATTIDDVLDLALGIKSQVTVLTVDEAQVGLNDKITH